MSDDFVVFTADERPDLWDESAAAFSEAWPEYNLHGDVAGAYFGVLVPRFADFQLLTCDARSGRLVARGRTIPFSWDGTLADLPAGIDAVGLRAVEASSRPNALSALSAEVVADRQAEGVSRFVIAAMGDLARGAGFDSLVAPVRPNRKERYPLVPIEQYATWVRPDGLPFDPWLRVHVRMGATTLRPEPHSMRITGTVREWEEWTGMELPADGDYVFPGGLAPLEVRDGVAHYWEPNVWMLHRIS
jgi:hypothetical protein